MWSSDIAGSYETGVSDQNGLVDLPPLRGRATATFPFVMDPIIGPAMVRFEAKGYVSREISEAGDRDLFDGSDVVQLSHESQK